MANRTFRAGGETDKKLEELAKHLRKQTGENWSIQRVIEQAINEMYFRFSQETDPGGTRDTWNELKSMLGK